MSKDKIHLNEIGNEIAAKVIVEKLIEDQLIPSNYFDPDQVENYFSS